MWDESPLRKWDLRGPDALALADALFTNDMSALEIGQVRYGAICDEHGKMIMDGTVFHLGEGHCLSITSYDSDLDWFRQVASDRKLDVEVEDRTAEMPHLQVQGPKARDVLRPITEGADVDALRYFRFVTEGVSIGGVPCWLSRTGYSGELGFELYCAPGDATALWHAVLEAGRPHGAQPIGLSAIETLRIESGLLFPDIDYFPHQTDPYEVRLDNVIKLDKQTDFVGREALRAIAAEGTPRLLVTLRIEGDQVPEYGAAVTRRRGRRGDRPQPLPEPDVRHGGDRDGDGRPRAGGRRSARRRRARATAPSAPPSPRCRCTTPPSAARGRSERRGQAVAGLGGRRPAPPRPARSARAARSARRSRGLDRVLVHRHVLRARDDEVLHLSSETASRIRFSDGRS